MSSKLKKMCTFAKIYFMVFENKNEKQLYFNQIKGVIEELNDGEKFCSITLNVGHENCRLVNFAIKKPQYNEVLRFHQIGDKVSIRFYLSSKHKNNRWYTMANVLEVFVDSYEK